MRTWQCAFAALCVVLFCTAASGSSEGPSGNSGQQTYTNSIGMEFVLIPSGSFPIVTAWDENDEATFVSKAIVSKAFYLGKYPVTQREWQAVMGKGKNPSKFKGSTRPVEQISWDGVQEFIKRLNRKEGHTRYRLPTEMEWELAARGGTEGRYFFVKTPMSHIEIRELLVDYAWFADNSGVSATEMEKILVDHALHTKNGNDCECGIPDGATRPVGKKKPNPYGLYDVYGNVWECVQDFYGPLPTEPELTNYRGPMTGNAHVMRGGSWEDGAEFCRSDFRERSTLEDFSNDYVGFRLALSKE